MRENSYKTIKCKHCGKELTIRRCLKTLYCSVECRIDHWRGSRKKSILVKCVICNKEFYVIQSRFKVGRGKCCSKKCSNELMKTNSVFVTNNPSKKEENKKKISESKKGEKSHNWLGGITPLRLKIYRSDVFKNWRDSVYKRDKFTCQSCGSVGGKLNAHHIKSFSDIMIENNIKTLEDALKCKELGNISNGVTLCKKCHEQTDNYGGKQKRKNNINFSTI